MAYSKYWQKKQTNNSTENLISSKNSFKNESEIKTFTYQQKLRESVAGKPTLQ